MRSDIHEKIQQAIQAGPDPGDEHMQPDWTRKCWVCGQTPILPLTGMCGPCTFGEADTVGGNWSATEVFLSEDGKQGYLDGILLEDVEGRLEP